MQKTILSLFFLATLGITSCSSDSDGGAATDATNVNLPVTYEPTSGNIATYARTGVNVPTTLLDLTGQNSSLKFELVNMESVVEVSTDGRKIQTKTNLPQNAVGEKTIQYKVVQTGTSFSRISELSFVVYYGENAIISTVTARKLIFNGVEFVEDDDSPVEYILKNIPYQYVVNENYMFQLCLGSNEGSFNSTDYGTAWVVVKLSQVEFTLPQLITNRNVRYKYKDLDPSVLTDTNPKFIELRVDPNSNSTEFLFINDKNECGWNGLDNPNSGSNVFFDCMDI